MTYQDPFDNWRNLSGRLGELDEFSSQVSDTELGHIARQAVLVFAWEAFVVYLVEELFERVAAWVPDQPMFNIELVESEKRAATRNYDQLKRRYNWAGLRLSEVKNWGQVEQVRLHRNALVHNGGRFTRDYLTGPHPRRPPDSVFGSSTNESLVDSEEIPLDDGNLVESMDFLFEASKLVRHYLDHPDRVP